MTSLGTRSFWKATSGTDDPAKQQILKLSGYINIVLQAAHYRSNGNFWQRIFKGSDQITLTSQVTYQTGGETIAAAVVQDARTVKANRSHYLGVSRNVALKVPADADGLELRIEISAVEDDNVQAMLSLLNSEEYQKPLELAAPVIGQILTISSLVKKLTSKVDPQKRLEATYPGIISSDSDPHPLQHNKLLTGYLILISATDDEERLLDTIDTSKLSVLGDGLKYENKPIQNTYIIFNISVDSVRGINPKAAWYQKFQEAIRKLDDLYIKEEDKWEGIYNESLSLWHQGSAMIDGDPMYIPNEKGNIKRANLGDIKRLYNEWVEKNQGKSFAGVSEAQKVSSFLPTAIATSIDFADETVAEFARNIEAYSSDLAGAGLTLSWDQ
jgi:hypothetical protein